MKVTIKIHWKDGTVNTFGDITEWCEIVDGLYIKDVYDDGDYDQIWINKDEIRYYEALHRAEGDE